MTVQILSHCDTMWHLWGCRKTGRGRLCNRSSPRRHCALNEVFSKRVQVTDTHTVQSFPMSAQARPPSPHSHQNNLKSIRWFIFLITSFQNITVECILFFSVVCLQWLKEMYTIILWLLLRLLAINKLKKKGYEKLEHRLEQTDIDTFFVSFSLFCHTNRILMRPNFSQ
jgi:hypothetical protein